MKRLLKILISFLGLFLFFASFTYALSVESVIVNKVSPGEEGIIKVSVENDGDRDIEFLSFNIDFPENNIIPIGSSEAFVNKLKENDDEMFAFKFRVANNLPAGTYSISYSIRYEEDNDERKQSGTIGIVVSAEPELEIVAEIQNPIIGQTGKLNIRVVNKGLADARFVSLSVESEDITILSEKSEYIGTIESDDFESTSFDVAYNKKLSRILVNVEYKDFDNNKQTMSTSIPLRAYTRNEAIKRGILAKSNTTFYVVSIVILLIVWVLFRFIRKRRKRLKN
ncbi:MAG: hypothetical protein AABX94_04160 [Nanoarchaeota archaeon]